MSSRATFLFWDWLFRGTHGRRPGYRRFVDKWLLLHVVVGVCLSIFVKHPLPDVALAVLLPLAGVFVGLSFAWAGNAQTVLQSPEVEELMRHHPGGRVDYIYSFQASILLILASLVAWGLMGLGIPDLGRMPFVQYAYASLLFFLASMTVRECWSVVLGAQLLILARLEIRNTSSQDNEDRPSV